MPATDIATEILAWSLDRPLWERDALRRLFSVAELSPAAIDELVGLCKAARGLGPPGNSQPLAREHLATKSGATRATALETLTHHRGANALAAEQTVSFGPRLTVVYGHNAAGKSGYTRILKQACRTRFSEPVLGNLLSGRAPVTFQATIKYRLDGDSVTTSWSAGSPPSDALAAVSVFDAGCAPVYLRDKTDVAFRPFDLDVFDRLATASGEVRKRLENEKAKLGALAPVLPTCAEGTKARHVIDHLSSLTDVDEVRSVATLSAAEQARLGELRALQRDLLATDPKQRARELTSRAERLELLARHLGGLRDALGTVAMDGLQTRAATLRAARQALALLRKSALTPDLLRGTGEEAWRRMWEAAEEYSAVAYPQQPFPVVGPKAQCVFCQQEIAEDAEARLHHLAEYVASTAQAQVREAERAHATALAAVRGTEIRRPEMDLVIEEVRGQDSALAEEMDAFLSAAAAIQKAALAASEQATSGPASALEEGPEARLGSAAAGLRERAKELLAQKRAMPPDAAAELKELEARSTLGTHLKVVVSEIERQKRLAAYDQCLADTSTGAITRKSTELTSRLVTDQLAAGFKDELRRLEFNHLAVEVRAAGGAKGSLFHRLVFSNAPGVAVTNVLSEGESRALSLAAFLAELRTAPSRSAIIFDDPVSSLDEAWRERIARRLVAEAADRQVIVFTHDLLFLRFLIDEAKRQEIECSHQYVRREGEAGICSADLPWIAMSTNDRIGRLRSRWQAAEKLFRTDPGSYEPDARDIFGLLREAWERATTEVLLNDVVERYRHSIETQRVRKLPDITIDDYKALEAGMTECSRWMRGHDQAPADGTPFPTPAALKKSIDDLDGWVKAIRNRRR